MAIITINNQLGVSLPSVSRQLKLEIKPGSEKTIHNDYDAAKREGLPEPVAVAPQVAAVVFRMMFNCFGAGWIRGGKWELTFRRPVGVNDFVTAKGVIQSKMLEGRNVRVECNVWVERQDGEKAIVGTASGLMPKLCTSNTEPGTITS